MRSIALLLAFVVTVSGVAYVAYAEGKADETGREKLEVEARLQLLELENALLERRVTALTAYVNGHAATADNLAQKARESRARGFEKAAIPVTSRKLLLQGLEGLAQGLRQGIPQPTADEVALHKAIVALKRKHRLK